ncbi:MAG: hypothetical protein IKN59_02270 [Paludibacteraceae bacterium]|jgi:hypothetical protein|nr:hypothetical protein [Paludibacteraceae bacterium]
MERRQTITIRSWMLTRLHLENWTLLVYAIIYQTRIRKPEGWTKTEISKWFNYNSGSTWRILNYLTQRDLLIHTKDGHYVHKPLPRLTKAQLAALEEENKQK